MPQKTIHACALVYGTTGLVIIGPSGSGKSRLGALLVEQALDKGRFARWVADDRVQLTQTANRAILAHVVSPLEGLVEYRFLGISASAHLPTCVVDRIVQLVDDVEMERMPQDGTHHLRAGLPPLPCLKLPCGNLPLVAELAQHWLQQGGNKPQLP